MPRNREYDANFLSRVSFWWMQPLIATGYKNPLEHDDLYELYPGDDTVTAYARFHDRLEADEEKLRKRVFSQTDKGGGGGDYSPLPGGETSSDGEIKSKEHIKKPAVKLWKVIYHVIKAQWWFAGVLLFIGHVFGFVGPFGINYIIGFAEDPSTALFGGDYFGVYAVLIMTVALLFKSIFEHHHHHLVTRHGSRIRSFLISLIYRKALRMPNYVKAQLSEGKISTLMSVDAERVMENVMYIHYLWTSPIELAVALYLLVQFLGTAAGLGALVMVLFIPLQMWVVMKFKVLARKNLAAKDKRLDLITEIMKGIRILKYYAWEGSYKDLLVKYGNVGLRVQLWKILKYYAWEGSYEELLDKYRSVELRVQLWKSLLKACSDILFVAGPTLMALSSFLLFAIVEERDLDPATAFTALSLFQLVAMPFQVIPRMIASCIDAIVSLNRMQEFLAADELPEMSPRPRTSASARKKGSGSDSGSSSSLSSHSHSHFSFDDPKRSLRTMSCIDAIVSLNRIQEFLAADELPEMSPRPRASAPGREKGSDSDSGSSSSLSSHSHSSFDDPKRSLRSSSGEEVDDSAADFAQVGSIVIRNGEFRWEKEARRPTIRNVNLRVRPGDLVMVVGKVGSGKSSLLSAILGEMVRSEPYAHVQPFCGSVAYAAQLPWILNMTLRDNILFGKRFDETMYARVVEASGLKQDLEVLPAGDFTEIGERGINLSGGQKQRIAIARALYANSDIYLLDDPLSALDSHTGEWVFQHAVLDFLHKRGKTVVLVTHQTQYTPFATHVINIEELSGTPDDVLHDTGSFSGRSSSSSTIDDHDTFRPPVINMEELSGTPDDVLHDTGSFSARSSSDDKDASLPPVVVVDTAMSINQSEAFEEASQRHGSLPRNIPVGDTMSINAPLLEQSSSTKGQKRNKADFESALSNMSQDSDNEEFDGLLTRQASLSVTSMSSATDKEKSMTKKGILVDDEERELGSVSWNVYFSYMKSSGVVLFPWMLFLILIYESSGIAPDFWLTIWSTDQLGESSTFYVYIYGALALGSVLILFVVEATSALVGVRAAKRIHRRLVSGLLGAPVTFFDTTPTGRIINRFSRDVNTIDTQLAYNVRGFAGRIFGFLLVVGMIIYIIYWFAIAVVPVSLLFIVVQQYYRKTSRELKRLDSVSKSPIFEHFTETLGGLSSIRAFRVQTRFTSASMTRVDHNTRAYFMVHALNRWLGTRLDFIGAAVFLCAAMSAVVFRDQIGNLGYIGLVIGYSFSLSSSLNWLVRLGIQTEIDLNAVERTDEYSSIPSEGFADAVAPRDSWPERGQIEFKSVSLRYRPGLPTVLKDVDLVFMPAQRIGVCGRTGSGKSTLLVSLFRMVELCGGSIEIDGVDIASVPLNVLRSNLSIIPQDPVFFQGSIRDNLDPFTYYSDERVWEVLAAVRMRVAIEELEGEQGLDSPVGEGGSSFSVGQRQLLCLARAILRGSRILVLDEATSSIDHATDALIQQMLREQFRDSTVVTIAHRLDTILDYDRIVVMEEGRVEEFGSPGDLMADEASAFSSLLRRQQQSDGDDGTAESSE